MLTTCWQLSTICSTACTSWLGSEVEGDFQKIQRFLKKCPESVQNEYADHISQRNSGVRIDELTMQWTDFESLIQTVWESSMIKERVRSGFGRPLDIVVPTQVHMICHQAMLLLLRVVLLPALRRPFQR